jgi:hypothetical protein
MICLDPTETNGIGDGSQLSPFQKNVPFPPAFVSWFEMFYLRGEQKAARKRNDTYINV